MRCMSIATLSIMQIHNRILTRDQKETPLKIREGFGSLLRSVESLTPYANQPTHPPLDNALG